LQRSCGFNFIYSRFKFAIAGVAGIVLAFLAKKKDSQTTQITKFSFLEEHS